MSKLITYLLARQLKTSAIKMFAKLFFIKDPQEIVKLVIAGLYPEAYLDAEDEKEDYPTNRDRIVKVCCRYRKHAYETTLLISELCLKQH